MRDRTTFIGRLREAPATAMLVVGGGINGVGLLRDLAARASLPCLSNAATSEAALVVRRHG